MGSKRLYEHAQNLLGDVKKEVGNDRTKGLLYGKRYYVIIIVS